MVKHPKDRAERIKLHKKKDIRIKEFSVPRRAKARIKERLKDQETADELHSYE